MTAAVVAGETSLGGSESACLGLARALKARGHDVTIAATKLDPAVPEFDQAGVRWLPSETLWQAQKLIDPDVFVALRQPHVFGLPVQARYRMLWCQDMLVGEPAKQQFMSLAWAYDAIAYVSQYQRKQWEGVAKELTPLGWVTKNGYDPAFVPTDVQKVPGRIIHISRPERAMTPLLAMWPELKTRVPHAELHICRYASMYDGEGSNVKAMVEAYDREIARVNDEVGGIVQLGQLGKRDLYRAIASAEVMWYPGIVDFAETSCIAAIEAQACGTPFVGSAKGALPETVPHGYLIPGDAMSAGYQAESLQAVEWHLRDYAADSTALARTRGLAHIQSYTFDAVAAEWEAHVEGAFAARVAKNPRKIVEALLHEDDHVAAKALAERFVADCAAHYTEALTTLVRTSGKDGGVDPDVRSRSDWAKDVIIPECDRVIRGEAQTHEQYGQFALDPEVEMGVQKQQRHYAVIEAFAGCQSILDLACGNGAFAIMLAEADPTRKVHAIDYSAQNIDVATAAAERHGVADRIRFEHATVCSLETGALQMPLSADYDGVFLGEFCEHVAGVQRLLGDVSAAVGPNARVVITVPSGPFVEMLPPGTPLQKGHVHHFRPRDLEEVFGAQTAYTLDYLDCGYSPRNAPLGHWVVRFVTSATPFGERPLAHWHKTLRPHKTLSFGILAHNCAEELNLCLKAVYPIADEIIVAACQQSGDWDELQHLAERYRKVTLAAIPHVSQLKGGFSEARNLTLQLATGDWFAWIDADEQLVGNLLLWKYLESGVFSGYALKQNHLMLDCPPHFDTPVRVFRKGDDIQFYGCVHEQPQQGDCNGDILPTLQLFDVQLAHTGYLHEGIRRNKATNRNLPLLVRDMQEFPDRLLGKVLWLRDLTTQAAWRTETLGGKPDAKVWSMYQQAIDLFEAKFLDPTHRFHDLARPFYEQAVCQVRGAIEVEMSLGGAVQGLKGRSAKPRRFWVRTPQQIKPLLDHHQAQALKVYDPVVIDVEPYVEAREAVAV